MKKNHVISALLLSALTASPVQAQSDKDITVEKVEYSSDKYKVETNHFWNNCFISVGAGPQIYFGDHDKQAKFGKRISPALDIAIGKWFTPGIGARIMYSGLSQRGATNIYEDHGHETSHMAGEPNFMYYQKFKFFNLHADVLFNLSNLFCGYKESRVWNTSLYAGLGWMRTWESPTCGDVSMNFGWLNSFRLCKALDLNVDLRSTLVTDRFDSEQGDEKHDGLLALNVGLTYKFKNRGWDRSKTVYCFNNTELEDMRRRLSEATAENERLKQLLAEGQNKEAEKVVKRIASASLITFRINRSTLSNQARANLGMMAEVIKQGDPDVVYTITGYADRGTGTDKINERLSKARAEAVYDCLVNEFGIDKNQLRIDYKGGVDNMFYDDPRLSRAVITRAQ